ncbi:MBL fold metallo-hydrolase [Pengzhenrongella sicca]|uniref:Hydrolase n=1 Tax=Pengzhenrongella sicca TaxID=2819238 RepID=A0A8A4ZIS4_9MICO|nr:MBL fold metallo-hydrolase [Pengzhenrongella sicca]QTE30879.1 hydrolase [Pengzhenrongella sicca]
MSETFWICATCGVEHAARVECRICEDERQWVPAEGQLWTTLEELVESGHRGAVVELESDLYAVTATPGVGIGQTCMLVRTPAGNLLWDPLGYVDDALVDQVLALGEVVAVAASHPHMFGVQVAWSMALGGVPVLVSEADREWVARPHPAIRLWSAVEHIAPGLSLVQVGGHFPGSAVAHWAAGRRGRGVILAGDTVMANPDRTSVSFMRSYPNRIPLSGPVVERIAAALNRLEFDTLYSNFGNAITRDAKAVLRRSVDRHIGWVRGEFDHLT